MGLGSSAKEHRALPKAVHLPCCNSTDDVPKLKTCPELGGRGVRRQKLKAKEETQLRQGTRCCPTSLEAQPPTRAIKPPPLPPLPNLLSKPGKRDAQVTKQAQPHSPSSIAADPGHNTTKTETGMTSGTKPQWKFPGCCSEPRQESCVPADGSNPRRRKTALGVRAHLLDFIRTDTFIVCHNVTDQ